MTENQSLKPQGKRVSLNQENTNSKRVKQQESKIDIVISRNRNVKKPYVHKNVAILYTARPITIKPRTTLELDMGLTFEYPEHFLPECNLLPSFRKYLILHSTKIQNDTNESYKVVIINRRFSDCLRIVKNTGLLYFNILNKDCNISYTTKYIN